jgi:hypothetical protein
VAHVRDWWQHVVCGNDPLGFTIGREFIDQLSDCCFSRRALLHGVSSECVLCALCTLW